ncbi:MAG TPA: AI-2E family transporter [Xanthobacteraceae bacterium]|nr:AI-2E family transporter [Xanthobacteraceae bacterium]
MNQEKKRSHVLSASPESSARRPLGASQVELTNPEPPEGSPVDWEAMSRFAIIGIGFVVTIAALFLARSILMPVAAALLIGVTLRPIQLYLARYRIPGPFVALVLIAAFSAILYFIVTLIAGSLGSLIAQTPDLGTLLREKLRWLNRPLSEFRDLQNAVRGEGESAPKVTVESNLPELFQSTLTLLTPAISELLVFLGTLLFFLVGTEKLRRQLITLFETRDARLTVVRIWNDIEQNLVAFVGTVTIINLGLGVVTGLMLYIVGFPSPLTFAVLAFVLNYIPYIGPAILVTLLLGFGLILSPTLGGAVLPPVLFVVLATLEGHFITPSIIGRRLTLNPFLVFLALAFWTWLWGPLGAFLATPLLIVVLVALGHLFPRDEALLPK